MPDALAERFRKIWQVSAPGIPWLTQEIVAEFIREGHFGRHIQRMRALYAERRNATATGLERVLGAHMRVVPQPGGMHLVAQMRGKGADVRLTERIRQDGMYTHALSEWAAESPVTPALLLSFTNIPSQQRAEELGKRILQLPVSPSVRTALLLKGTEGHPMTQRLNYFKIAPAFSKKLQEFAVALGSSDINKEMESLIDIRASQLNGCAFCLDMHVKQAKIHGERELRLHHIAIWRESSLFTARERAVLEWTEAVTQLPPHGISDETYQAVRKEFSEQELTDLTFRIVAINGWNRLSIAFRNEPGSMDAAFGLDKAGLS